MANKKNAFLTFCFSLLPGAGQMYMGFMKRGISLMSSFLLIIMLSTWLNLEPLLLAVPIVWFFSFFDTHNLRSLPDDEFRAFRDDFIIMPEFTKKSAETVRGKYRNIIAVSLIVIGFALLWNNVFALIQLYLPDYVSRFLYRIGHIFPQMLIGAAIMAFGIILIRGKKKDLDAVKDNNQLEDLGGMQNGKNS